MPPALLYWQGRPAIKANVNPVMLTKPSIMCYFITCKVKKISMKNKKNNIGKSIYIIVVIGLLLAFFIIVLEKQQIINLYQKPVSIQQQPRPVNDVAYTPTTPQEQQEADNIKKEALAQADKPITPPEGILEVSLSAANQDSPGGPLVVRAIINGATSGTCKLLLTQNGNIKEYTSTIANKGTYYGCEGFDIPSTDLNAGNWKLVLEAYNGVAKGSAGQEVNITL